jgi:hypothetical protein
LADCGKLCENCHSWKQTTIFTFFVVAEIHIWWVQILIRDPDPCQVESRFLNRSESLPWKKYGSSFYELSVLQSELWQNPLNLRTLIWHLWMRYCTVHIWTVTLKRTIFKWKYVFGKLSSILGL